VYNQLTMEIDVAKQRILFFNEQVTQEEAQSKAWDKKVSSFDTLSKFGSFLTRPKDDDFVLTYQEHRYQPFWHVIASARYVYDRSNIYEVKTSGLEVKSVTYQKTDFEVTQDHIHVPVLEHCIQEDEEEVFIDGVTGNNNFELKQYLSLSPKEVVGKLEKFASPGSIFVPPQTRVSAIMRDSLAKMIKGIQADTILEETVEVTCVDLYYHPIYAFEYRWISKNKQAIVEVDGLTGQVRTGSRVFNEYLGKVLDTNFLFDLGADAAGMLIPGGSIAVKIAKKYIDSHAGKR